MIERFGPPHVHIWSGWLGWWPGTVLSVFGALFWLALCIALVWALLHWLVPYLMPRIERMFFVPQAHLSPMEILRQRYAEGAIDTDTFEMMRERLDVSYQRTMNSEPH
ncbi:MAG TPA: SHOCT domain-containing protein [Ktedonobacteraceae bacterium]|nr:SHOCT domain-containing protein [Ktedonobacteraceae bacterium]